MLLVMEVLRKEVKEWIASKDAEVQAAGQACEGGSNHRGGLNKSKGI